MAVAITHGMLGSHLGVAYRDSAGVARLLHLAFHRTLVVDAYPQPDWLAARVPVDELVGAQIVSLLEGAAKLYPNPRMPESFDYGINLLAGQGSIEASGAYSPKDGCDGYTCASIIAEIFRRFGYPLVDLATWPERDVNRAWGLAIVCMLRAYGASPEHLAAVERNVSGLRLRPEEVAVAAERFRLGHASTFLELEGRSEEVMAQVQRECRAPAPPPATHPMAHCVEVFQRAVATAKVNSSAAQPTIPVIAPSPPANKARRPNRAWKAKRRRLGAHSRRQRLSSRRRRKRC